MFYNKYFIEMNLLSFKEILIKQMTQLMIKKRPILVQNCSRFVCHLFIPDGEDTIKSHASGVLIHFGGQYYLLTAAHVVDGIDIEHICIPKYGTGTFIILGGEWHRVDPTVAREEDKIDLAFLHLDDVTVSSFREEGYDFLEETLIGLKHKLKDYSCYLIIGFPASKSKYNKYKNTISEQRLVYVTKTISPSDWPKELYYKNRNICLVRREKAVNQQTDQECQLPDPRGISGGGLWFLDDLHGSYKLVGIMIEYTKTIYVATKIDLFIKAIAERATTHSDVVHL